MASEASVVAAPPVAATPAVAKGKKQKDTIFGISKLFFLLGAAILGFIITRLPIAGLKPEGVTALGIFVFTVCLWIFEVFPTGISSILFGVLLTVILGDKIMPTSIAFSGFTNTTFFLLLGAFLIGEGTVKSGVAERIALFLMRMGGSSYKRVIVFLWIASAVLGVLTPSGTVRVVMMIPIMAGIVSAYKAPIGSKFSANLFLQVYWGSMLGSNLWYTGSNINPLSQGIAKAITGYEPSFLVWTIWQIVPCLVFFAGSYLLINFIFPPEKEIVATGASVEFIRKRLAEMGAMKPEEKRALGILLVAIILWITQPFHGIDTAWVAVAAGAALFLPKLGVLGGKALNNVSWDTLLLLGVALGIGGILKAVGLDVWITKTLLNPLMAPFAGKGELVVVFGIVMVTALLHFLMASGSSQTSALAPLMAQWANVQGFNIHLTTLAVSRSAMNVLLFPYQSTPMLAMWGTGYLDMRKALIGFGACSAFQIVWITAMAPYWDWIMSVVR
jgi:anion transporter